MGAGECRRHDRGADVHLHGCHPQDRAGETQRMHDAGADHDQHDDGQRDRRAAPWVATGPAKPPARNDGLPWGEHDQAEAEDSVHGDDDAGSRLVAHREREHAV